MDPSLFSRVLERFHKEELYDVLIEMNIQLTKNNQDLDYAGYLDQLNAVIDKYNVSIPGKKPPQEEVDKYNSIKLKLSSNLFRLLSRNLTIVFSKLPTKIYDLANNLLNNVNVANDELPPITNLSIIVLIDLFETYPNSLTSLINFSINQIYKILKKEVAVSANLIYLLQSLTKYCTKSDVDDKLQQKLLKIITKNITSLSVVFGDPKVSEELNNDTISSISLKKNYILTLKNISILSVNANYEQLLYLSASSNSAGAKLKPEAIMQQQHQFQSTLLYSLEKPIIHGFSNYCKDIRLATVELLSNLFINFIPTGKFDPIEYLVSLYKLPPINGYDQSLTVAKTLTSEDIVDVNKNYTYSEIEEILESNLGQELFNAGILETLIFYIQLEQYQNPEYLSTNLLSIITIILNKLSIITKIHESHVQDNKWVKLLDQFKLLFNYLIKETGSTAHELLLRFLFTQFDTSSGTEESEEGVSSDRKAKKQSGLFSLKSSKGGSRVRNDSARISPYYNPYQCALLLTIIEELIPFGIDFNTLIQGRNMEKEEDNKEGQSETTNENIEDENRLEAEMDAYLVDLILKLLINHNDYIRNYALLALQKYAKFNKLEFNQLVLTCFHNLSKEVHSLDDGRKDEASVNLDINTSPSLHIRIMSYSMGVLSLIRQADSVDLQNATIAKILSFCTQNLKHNTTNTKINCLKNFSCWVILTSLITFHDESEFVKLNSSQFLVFWKNLLTAQYVPSGMGGEDGDKREIIDNLKLRSFSLVCLLNYIETVKLSPDTTKQILFLLTKSLGYLNYLENEIDGIGEMTYLSKLDEFNINTVNNFLLSKNSINPYLSFKNMLVTLILHGKRVILQGLTKLAPLIRNDINSSLLVHLIKLFSDPKCFSTITDVKEKSKSNKTKKVYTKVADLDKTLIFLGEDSIYNFGVSSKYNDSTKVIDQSYDENSKVEPKTHGLEYLDPFYNSDTISNDDTIKAWFDIIEDMCNSSTPTTINYDPSLLLVHKYSKLCDYSPNLVTSLIDYSIDVFRLVFPYVTVKVQSSLLEQMRTALISKAITPLRYNAICVNISIAIHDTLEFARGKNISFSKDLINIMIDIIKKIESTSKNLVEINADSIGLAMSFCDKKVANEQIDNYLSSIVNENNPYSRGRSLITMSKIHGHTMVGAGTVYNVAFQLLNDPHPVVNYYSALSLTILFEKNMGNDSRIIETLDRLYSNYLNDDFSYDIRNRLYVNLRYKYGTMGLTTNLLKNFVTCLGPNLLTFSKDSKIKLRNLIISLRYAIGVTAISDHINLYLNLLQLLQELIIFDPQLIDNEMEFYLSLLNSIISKNMKIGLVTIPPTSLQVDSIFPYNSSFTLYKLGYICFTELLKVYGNQVLTKEMIQLSWVSLNIRPCEEVKNMVSLWLESSLDMNWFATLNSLFKVSSKKLVSPYIEVNFQQKLLPLLQRQKKKNNASLDFKDEEIENIVGDDGESDDKNEPISWDFKLFIYTLLNHLLELADKNSGLLDRLKERISDIVKVAFLGSTAPINIIQLEGIHLLDKALGLFGDLEDPIYPGVSILEQQQAQIISAIIPCFNAGSNAEVIVNAINVSSKFINLPRIKFYSKQRILKTLIYLLEELSSNKFLRFGFLESLSEHGKKSIQVSILNCWAVVKLNCNEDIDTAEPELVDILDKYSTLLVSLWVLTLKEFSTLKYTDTNSRDLEIYGEYWINFVSVLSLELEENKNFVEDHLGGDASTFFFILFSQCIETLIRNKNVSEVLTSVNSLTKNPELVNILFHDEIYGELVDLFDRLVLIDDDPETQCKLIDILSTIFQTYITTHHELNEDFDKLFELVRLSMLPLFNILPFLRNDFDPEDPQVQLTLKEVDSGPNLVVLKHDMDKLVSIITGFSDIVKLDLCSCLLFIFSKIYEFKNELLISIILPYLKQVIKECKDGSIENNLIETFSDIIKNCYDIDHKVNFTILTTVILTINGDIALNETDSQKLAQELIAMVQNPNTLSVGVQCMKSLILHSCNSSHGDLLVVKLIVKLVIKSLLDDNDDTIDTKTGLEILLLLCKLEHNDTKVASLYSLMIPLVLKFNNVLSATYLHDKLIELIECNQNTFKQIINSLSSEQKQCIRSLVQSGDNQQSDDEAEIQLKTFG